MTAKLYHFNGETSQDLPPDQVLEQALGKLQRVVVLGIQEDGRLYTAASAGTIPEALYLLEKCKKILIDHGDN
jgi:hypothetical protein